MPRRRKPTEVDIPGAIGILVGGALSLLWITYGWVYTRAWFTDPVVSLMAFPGGVIVCLLIGAVITLVLRSLFRR